jgi:hypothetical protein
LKNKLYIVDDRPIVLYNADKKEVIGIFESQSLAGRYLYPVEKNHKGGLIKSALSRKSKIFKSVFDFPVAIRYANEIQTELLNGEEYLIINDYPIPHSTKMKGFTTTKESFKIEAVRKFDSYRNEQKNKKSELKKNTTIVV